LLKGAIDDHENKDSQTAIRYLTRLIGFSLVWCRRQLVALLLGSCAQTHSRSNDLVSRYELVIIDGYRTSEEGFIRVKVPEGSK
jgi:hypothetical protein